jgi:hypothetical protein
MGSVQTDYGVPSLGVPGLRVPGKHEYSLSLANGESTSPLPFGRMVRFKSGDEDNSASLLTGTGAPFAGIVTMEPDYDRTTSLGVISGDTNGTPGPKPGFSMTLMRIGTMWVEVEATVKSGDRPFVRHTANGGNTMIGVFSNAAGTGLDDITNCGVFVQGGPAGGVALLCVDLTTAVAVPSLGAVAAANLNAALLADIVQAITMTPGALTSHVITTTVQVKDPTGAAVTGARKLTAWLTDTAGAGAGLPTSTAADGGITVTGTAAGILKTITTGIELDLLTGVSGACSIVVQMSTAHTYYLNVVCGDGAVVASTALVFT